MTWPERLTAEFRFPFRSLSRYMQSHVDNSLHELTAAGAPATPLDAVLTDLLHKADLWGLL